LGFAVGCQSFYVRKGQTYVKTWMQKNFNIVLLTNSQLSNILGLFAKFTSELGVDGGTVQLAFCELKAFCFLGLVFAQNKCHF
jgi:hypothetical protein